MSKRMLLVLSFLIISIVLALGSGISFNSAKDYLKSLFSKPTLRVAALGRHGSKWIPGNILHILESKYKIVYVNYTDQDYDMMFVSDSFGEENFDAKGAVKVYWTSEAYIPNLDNYDLVMAFEHINSPKYIRLPYYYSAYRKDIRVTQLPRENQGECNPKKPKFACFLVSNGSTDYITQKGKVADGVRIRDNAFYKLSEYKLVASGGEHLNNIGGPIPRGYKTSMEWLGQCKFIIAYENQRDEGYITEKVFQAYFAGAIPIYWGDKTAVSDVNRDAIIYANDFESDNDLVNYVKKVDSDDDLYCKIWNQHLLTNHELDYDVVHNKVKTKIFELIDQKLKK